MRDYVVGLITGAAIALAIVAGGWYFDPPC